MPKLHVTNGSGFLGRLVHFRFLTPAPEVGNLWESAWRAPDESAALGVPEVPQTPTVSRTAEDLDHRAEALDAVAGSEFVDDRIRVRE